MKTADKIEWLGKIKDLNNGKSPFLAVDVSRAVDNVATFRSALPECGIYYAIKSFSDEAFLKSVASQVDGFDVASLNECRAAISAGVAPKDIMFSNPVKKPDHIQGAVELGVSYFAFDSINELEKLAQLAPGSNVYIRAKVGDNGSAFPLSSKFGASSVHLLPLVATAKDMGLNPVGITFHVGSQSENLESWEVALELCGITMEKLEQAGIRLEFVNLGGGFPADYGFDNMAFADVVSTINASISKFFPYEVELRAEPGRFISANAGVMVASVIGRERRGSEEWLFTDVGSFHGLIEPLEMSGWRYPIFTESDLANKSGEQSAYTITGPTCDSSDTFAYDTSLSAALAVGDQIYVGMAGAYTVVYATDFNGFDAPRVVYVK